MAKLDGSCLCGSVTYGCGDAEPLAMAVCHCTDCQKQTGTTFSMVVVVPRDHVVSAFDSITAADLVDELQLEVSPELTPAQAVQTVAAGTGVVVLPMSVARLHHRKDVVTVPVDDLPTTQVGLAWLVEQDDPRVEDFIGVVRGRTERSSRGRR